MTLKIQRWKGTQLLVDREGGTMLCFMRAEPLDVTGTGKGKRHIPESHILHWDSDRLSSNLSPQHFTAYARHTESDLDQAKPINCSLR